MTSDLLTTLKNLDPALLLDPVRRDQRSPSFESADWDVQPISHAVIMDSTGGLFRFSGHGSDNYGVKPWSIVLKVLSGTNDPNDDITNIFYWKREALAFESGQLEALPNAIRLPRYYGRIEREDGVWLWMEHLVDHSPRRWSLGDFQRAMRQFGRFGGAYLNGTPLPQASWLSKSSYRSGFRDGGGWKTFMNPASENSAWKHPIVQRSFSEAVKARALGAMAEIDRFCDAADRLPQVFCHKDLNRRNLMFCTTPEDQEELVVIDWAWCGSGALGIDASWTLVDGLYFLDFSFTEANALEATIFEGYLSGLRDVGWTGDERLARLGYLIPLAIWSATLPGWAAMMLGHDLEADTMPMYGHKAPDVLATWIALEDFLLERTDQARALLRDLDF